MEHKSYTKRSELQQNSLYKLPIMQIDIRKFKDIMEEWELCRHLFVKIKFSINLFNATTTITPETRILIKV